MTRIQRLLPALSLAFVLSACTGDNPGLDGSPPPDQAARADTGARHDLTLATDFSTGDGAAAPSDLAALADLSANDLALRARPDLAQSDLAGAPVTCLASGGCMRGVSCGNTCCGEGERCDSTNDTCHCGNGGPCTPGQHCASFGPQGQNGCGAICCGGEKPCPF